MAKKKRRGITFELFNIYILFWSGFVISVCSINKRDLFGVHYLKNQGLQFYFLWMCWIGLDGGVG